MNRTSWLLIGFFCCAGFSFAPWQGVRGEEDSKSKNQDQSESQSQGQSKNLNSGIQAFTDWIPAEQRKSIDLADVAFTDQGNRRGKFSELHGRPTAVSFFYTRCENSRKCSTTVQQFADLQVQLKKAGLETRVNLLLITFEPQHDKSGLLKSYGASRGFQFDAHNRLVHLDEESMPGVIKALDVPVNYNSGWVNIHGLALYVMDREGKLARKYHTLMWDNANVLADLQRLNDEAGDSKP